MNYGNPEGGYVGNLYPASFGMNPVSFPFYTFLCLSVWPMFVINA